MASIQKQPSGQWRARYRDDAGKEHARHFKLKIDAKKWLDGITTSVGSGTYVDPKAGKVTFRGWFEQWSGAQVWTAGTRAAAQQAADCTTFSEMPMSKITEAHVQAWLEGLRVASADRERALAPSTIHMQFNYVRMAFLAAGRGR